MAREQYASKSVTFRDLMQAKPIAPRKKPGPKVARLAIVLHGKIANELHRSFTMSALPSSGIVGASYCALRDMLLEPAAKLFDGIDIFGHSWSPETQPLIEALYRPTAVQFETDMMTKFDVQCRFGAGGSTMGGGLGGPGGFYPLSCGRTMSHLLGMYRAIQLKSRHELKQGFEYKAVLVSRWDVLWQSPDVARWLGQVVKSDQFDRIWLPDMCGEETRRARFEPAESAYKARVCGVNERDGRKIKTQISTAAQACGRSNRGCDWDQMPSTRGIFLLDWWFLSSSELADGFGQIWNDFENLTVAVKTELVTEKKRRGATMGQSLAGIWIFGHLYWGLHIFKTMRAPVDWAPLAIGIDHTISRMATSAPHGCIPSAAQLRYGATGVSSGTRDGIGPGQWKPRLLKLPPSFELESGQPASTDSASRIPPDQFNFTEAALHFGAGGSPLARACRQPGMSINRGFHCPGPSVACESGPGMHLTALAAGRFIETTKNWNQVVKGCAPYGGGVARSGGSGGSEDTGRGHLGGAACAEGLKALWVCLREASAINTSFSNCTTNLLVRRSRAYAFIDLPQSMRDLDGTISTKAKQNQKRVFRENRPGQTREARG
tara:strand:- start:93 stop:1910 length:1818 start_codon:yes stop_codon:yes gene_type:complete